MVPSFFCDKILWMTKKKMVKNILLVIFGTVSLFLFFVMLWLFRTWPALKIQELIYQMTMPFTGTGSVMIRNFIVQAVVPSCVVLLLLIFLTFLIKRKIINKIILIISCLSLFGSLFYTFIKLDIYNYLNNQNIESNFIEENYVDPNKVDITFPTRKRNLIYIYLESMEVTYSDVEDGGGFTNDYIPELTALAQENECFSSNSKLNGAHSYPYTTWTMGGLFASSAGLPLITSIDRNQMDTQNSFFSNAMVLGDILEKEGYTQVYACGSDATFGGRKIYYEEHGNYEIHDLNYRREVGDLDSEYYENWGFEDEKLIEWAKEDINELANQDEPFNYTMLTADTHFEDGYVCDDCEDTYDDQYANVIACSSKRIYEFIEWCTQQSWYENTTIIISGDHPTMDSDFCNDVDESYQREVYTCIIHAGCEKENSDERTYSTFDLFPTTLASLGVTIEGDRLGLGTNLFSNQETLSEKYGIDDVEQQLYYQSTFMKQLEGDEVVSDLIDSKSLLKEESVTNASVTFKSSLFSSNISVYVEGWNDPEKVKHMICVVYDESDVSNKEEYMMAMNYNNQYEVSIKKDSNKKIRIYAQYEDDSIVYVGKLD